MGLSFHGHKKKHVDAERHLRRLHKTTPIIESPLEGADHENLVFSQRHEANSVELFFDLFFVANLATFTAYHSITDIDYLLAYIGFFGILWSSWFQITLHDVRFARDSLYERCCKTIQFIVFVGLALVGSAFNPAGDKADNQNFRLLCYTLVISRGLLAIQYMVVLFYTWRARYSKLYLPLGMMIAIYTVGTGAFAAMTPAFREQEQEHHMVYVVWYIVVVLEAIAAIAISCFWRMLSFKKTHLMERMSLLTIIVIGEGAIGVTKTVSRIMGKHGLDVEGCFLIMCIIVILVFVHGLYFDNFPHGHYGTIRQQVWSLLHFPLQLAIVGVVEGSQQIAMARYVMKSASKASNKIIALCEIEHYDGERLRDALMETIEYFRFNSKMDTRVFEDTIEQSIYQIGNTTGICSIENVNEYGIENWPASFVVVDQAILNGLYTGLGVKIPIDKLEKYMSPIEIAMKSWKLTYMYFWSSFCLLIACLLLLLLLIRRHRADAFDYVSIIMRCLVLMAGGAMLAVMASNQRLYELISSPALLPACVVLLFLILVADKLSASGSNYRLLKSGEPYGLEHDEEHHGHHHSSSHGDVHEHELLHGHFPNDKGSVGLNAHRMSAWSIHSDAAALLKEDTTYNPASPYNSSSPYNPASPNISATEMELVITPPLLSPDPLIPGPPRHGRPSSGYIAVNSEQNLGA